MLSSDVLNIHRRLSDRYLSLRESRSTLPVFSIEHGLNEDERTRLETIVSSAVRRYGTSPEYWRNAYLPLLAAASEVGYVYQGTGTDFWPKLEKRLKIGRASCRERV